MPLVLDLLRHGDALPSGAGSDAGRTLSPRGIAALRRLGRRLAEMEWRPGAAYTSPLVRAVESASVILESAGVPLRAGVLGMLEPGGDRAAVLAEVVERHRVGHVLLVGHQPLLGDLGAWLTGTVGPSLPTGTLARITFDGDAAPGAGRLTLRLAPEDVR